MHVSIDESRHYQLISGIYHLFGPVALFYLGGITQGDNGIPLDSQGSVLDYFSLSVLGKKVPIFYNQVGHDAIPFFILPSAAPSLPFPGVCGAASILSSVPLSLPFLCRDAFSFLFLFFLFFLVLLYLVFLVFILIVLVLLVFILVLPVFF